MRPLPLVVPETEAFWRGGGDGRLVMKRCPSCGRLWHPSQIVCADCHHRELEPAEVSGRATVVGCTVNVQQWLPDPAPPYVVAIVALDEDPRVRLTTNVIDVEPDDVTIGMRVEVRFEQQDDVWLPLFAPEQGAPPTRRAVTKVEPELPEVVIRPMVSPDKFEDRVAITGIGDVRRSDGGSCGSASRSPSTRAWRRSPTPGSSRATSMGSRRGRARRRVRRASRRAGRSWSRTRSRLRPDVASSRAWRRRGRRARSSTRCSRSRPGLCRHVLCYRTVWESTATELMRSGRLAPPSRRSRRR